jgi:membrane associated rhomboid family serine protease
MRSAAVGFQCPSCVAEGAKQTRSGRTAFGGVRSDNPRLTSVVLIGINVVVFALINLTGRYASKLYDLFALRATGSCNVEGRSSYYPSLQDAATCRLAPDGRWVPGASDGAPWQLITSVFTHVEFWHIAVNMLGLFLLGPILEQVTGRTRFLALYLLSGLAGSAVVLLLSDSQGGTVGASGALYGLMGALLVIAWRHHGNVQLILTNLVLNVVVTFSVPNISWQGHLGGFVGGCLVAGVLEFSPPGPRRNAWQLAGLSSLAVVLAAATVAGILSH